ncbi:hypothetical protein MtrunA17_Chr2g0329381 [Medicago truncatula]|uniref:Uncharacterized protein n=1 Tax=Medicago truncatula TaxID=3880 RepID=G7IHU7_MEDTR|nr:hypothetical protein MTR_2g098900 [Medicago truncatula]RHN76195.1 hypothetical protein MtrunA17_Chr2g0329381 [Medicago truncatula]
MFLASSSSSLPCQICLFNDFFPSVFLIFSLTRSGSPNRPSHRFLASHTGFHRFNCMTDPISRPNRSRPRLTVQPIGPSFKTMMTYVCRRECDGNPLDRVL